MYDSERAYLILSLLFQSWLNFALAVTVLDLQFTGCPPEGRAITRFPSGYLSNNLYLPHSSLGRENCPWVVEARPGQRIQLSILSLHPSISESTTVCPRIVIVDSANAIQPESDFNVCIRRSRERQLYTSHGHQVIVHSTDGSTGSNSPSGHSAAKAKDKKFIIVYKGNISDWPCAYRRLQ